MSRYSMDISVEQYQKASKKNTIDELYEQLDELEKEYTGKKEYVPLPDLELPKELEMDRLEFEKKSEEELKKRAEKDAEQKLGEELNTISQKAENSNSLHEKQIENKQALSEIKAEKLEEKSNSEKESAKKVALKNGLSRSSIISSQVKEIENSKGIELSYMQREAATEISYLQSKIDGNLKLLEDAKTSYDSNLAYQIEDRLLDLLSKQESEYAKVVKHNNDVEKKQADYLMEKSRAENSRLLADIKGQESAALYGTEQKRQEHLRKQMDAAESYFDSMSPKEALKIIQNDERLKTTMGNYYKILLRNYENKAK